MERTLEFRRRRRKPSAVEYRANSETDVTGSAAEYRRDSVDLRLRRRRRQQPVEQFGGDEIRSVLMIHEEPDEVLTFSDSLGANGRRCSGNADTHNRLRCVVVPRRIEAEASVRISSPSG